MNIGAVLHKTRKGLEEVETRSHRLPGRLRAVLIMVDGQRTGAQLLEQAGELSEQLATQLNDLITLGFIEESRDAAELVAPDAVTPAATSISPPSEQAQGQAVGGQPIGSGAQKSESSAATWTTVPLEVLKTRLGKMLNDSLGMRAMFLTAQVNSARSHRDLEAVVDEIAQSLATSMGATVARQWRLDARVALGMPG